jgi:hypothetical protein
MTYKSDNRHAVETVTDVVVSLYFISAPLFVSLSFCVIATMFVFIVLLLSYVL